MIDVARTPSIDRVELFATQEKQEEKKASSVPRKQSFTVYELLIATAIIMLLVAILMPCARMARNAAGRIKCIGNLKSWGISFTLYANDHEGLYPLSWINNSDHWASFMADYVEPNWLTYEGPPTYAKRLNATNCGCPGYARWKHPSDPNFRNFPYAYNAARFDYPYGSRAFDCSQGAKFRHIRGRPDYPTGWMGWDTTMSGPLPNAGFWDTWGVGIRYNGYTNVERFAHVPPTMLYTKPAQSVTMFCGIAASWQYYSLPYQAWLSGGGGSDWNACTGDFYLKDPTTGQPAYTYNGAPLGVHGGVDNYLFMDGHVESLKVTDTNRISRLVYNQVPNNNNPYR